MPGRSFAACRSKGIVDVPEDSRIARHPSQAVGGSVDQGAFGGLICGLPNGSFFTEFGENPLALFVGVAVTLP